MEEVLELGVGVYGVEVVGENVGEVGRDGVVVVVNDVVDGVVDLEGMGEDLKVGFVGKLGDGVEEERYWD